MSFSERLRKWRGKRRQKEAAADLDVTLAAYRKWEYGKRTPKKITLAEIDRRMISNPDTTKI
jgi:transcriptional regulator with XRE-family HTH domain